MEEKKPIKISLSAFLFFISIIVIIIMGYFICKFYNDKNIANKEIADLNNQINDLENNVSSLQSTIDNISNTINSSSTTANTINKYTEITDELNGIDVLYVTSAINNGDSYTLKGLIYTQYTLDNSELQQIINNKTMNINNVTYTIKRTDSSDEYDLYKENEEYPMYKIKKLDSTNYYLECQAQISDVWKKTDEYRQITILSNTKCSMNSENEGESQTVGDIFKNYEESSPIETTNPDENRTFIFKFENGKCTEVISTLTSI